MIINFLFKDEENENNIFNEDNVIFINLSTIEDYNNPDNNIPPFGMDYLHQKIGKIFKIILKEESVRYEKWEKLQNDYENNKISDIKEIIKEMNFYNISTNNLSQRSNNILKSLINENIKKGFTVDIKRMGEIYLFPCERCGFFHPILCDKCGNFHLNIKIKDEKIKLDKEKDGTFNLTINPNYFQEIFQDFIEYKIKCISSLEFYFNDIKDSNKEVKDNTIKDNTENNKNKDKNNNKTDIDINGEKNYTNSNNNENIFPYSDRLSTNSSEGGGGIKINLIINNLKGIKNKLNECFMISTLQCLIHCKPFIEEIIKEENNLFGILEQFYEICRIQSLDKSYSLTSLDSFKEAFNKKEFCDGEQHDSMEFCRYLLEQISDEINSGKKFLYESLDYEGMPLKESYAVYKNNIFQRENIMKIFNLNIASKFQCNICKRESISYQSSVGLPLLFLNEKNISLDDLVEEYFKNEMVEKEYKNCKQNVKTTKTTKICELPQILILCIQREENDRGIKLNTDLKLDKYIEEDLKNNINNCSYKIKSIINHVGNKKEGHYYCYINIENKYYEFNDSSVKEREIDMENNTSYIIYYEKIINENQNNK